MLKDLFSMCEKFAMLHTFWCFSSANRVCKAVEDSVMQRMQQNEGMRFNL